MRARIAVLASLALVLALAACEAETEPATNITSTGAQLNAKGRCTGVESGRYKWQTRAQIGESPWVDQSPWQTYSCQSSGDFVALSRQASGLQTGVQHFFRLLADPDPAGGDTFTIDRDWSDNGSDGGQDYDQFTPGP